MSPWILLGVERIAKSDMTPGEDVSDQPDWPAPYGDLADADTGKEIRAATEQELEASRAAAETDGGRGVIIVDGKRCFVWEPGS